MKLKGHHLKYLLSIWIELMFYKFKFLCQLEKHILYSESDLSK